ncbi:hypothetical protein ES707_20185 [subsurface metagenome]
MMKNKKLLYGVLVVHKNLIYKIIIIIKCYNI